MTSSSSVAYIASDVLTNVYRIAKKKYKCSIEDIGMIYPEVQKKEYDKLGQTLISHQIDFIVFDRYLNKIGVVKRKEIQKMDPAKSGTSNAGKEASNAAAT